MAGAEVIVSSGDLMTMKEEEGDPSSNDHRTQVILHLQPILHRVNEDIADTATTVVAVEAHHEDSKAGGEEIEYGYPITCGGSRAVLLFKKFVCPGINVRCVKFNDQLISPKQFVHLAGKATLKDWKRAIRLGGVMMRKMMNSGQIDFYRHDSVCSNTCRSNKVDVLINSMQRPPGKLKQPNPSCLTLPSPGGQMPLLTGEVIHNAAEAEEPLEEKFSATSAWTVNPTVANGHAAKRKRADTPDGVVRLWQGVSDAGLMGEVLSSLQSELLATLQGVEARSENSSLRETDSVKKALDVKLSRDEVHNEDHVLDEILECQRKQGFEERTTNKKNPLKSLHRGMSNSQRPSFLSPVKATLQHSGTRSSAASYPHLTGDNELFTRFTASIGQCHYTRANRMDNGSHSATQEKLHELNETGEALQDWSRGCEERGRLNKRQRTYMED